MDMPSTPAIRTPGVGATRDAKRLDRKDAVVITKILSSPSLTATPSRSSVPSANGGTPDWRGALRSRITSDQARRASSCREFQLEPRTVYDVIARMPGTIEPISWIIHGNHHDAWVNAPTIGQRPRGDARVARRSASWRRPAGARGARSSLRPGMRGAALLARPNGRRRMRPSCAACRRVHQSDSNGRGFSDRAARTQLEKLVTQVARDVTDPQRGSLSWNAAGPHAGQPDQPRRAQGVRDRQSSARRPRLTGRLHPSSST